MAAWETISDPGKRREYDVKWVHIRRANNIREETEKHQAETFKAEEKRAAEEKVILRNLEGHRSNYENQIFEINRVIRKLATDVKRLQNQDDEQLRKERERNSWWTYLTSPIAGKPAKQTEEQKQQEENGRIQRLNSKRIKENDLARQEASVQSLKDKWEAVNNKIVALKKRNEDTARAQEAARQERIRKEQEAKRQAEEQERWEKILAEQARRRTEEAAARAAKQAREAQEAREAEERIRRDQERLRRDRAEREAQRSREAQQAWHREHRPPVARAAAQTARNHVTKPATKAPSTASKKTTCRHDGFWPKMQGSHLCDNCHSMQRRFAFQCPGCKMIACANCRQNLRGERGKYKSRTSAGPGVGYDNDDVGWGSTNNTFDYYDD